MNGSAAADERCQPNRRSEIAGLGSMRGGTSSHVSAECSSVSGNPTCQNLNPQARRLTIKLSVLTGFSWCGFPVRRSCDK
jgi:hypothetical protein